MSKDEQTPTGDETPMQPRFTAQFVLTEPDPGLAGSVFQILDGTVPVGGTFDLSSSNTPLVKAYIIQDAGQVGNTTPHANAVECDLHGFNFSHPGVPNAQCNADGTVDNFIVAWQRVGDPSENLWDPLTSPLNFLGQCVEEKTISVSAQRCLWFAFAPSGYLGPFQEEGAPYRPVEISIPPNATSIEISAPSMVQTWTNHSQDGNPGTLYDADGKDAAGNATDPGNLSGNYPAYQTNYGAQPQITGISESLGVLVGMWVYQEGQGTTEMRIGTSWSSPIPPNGAPSRPIKLLLAFHDFYEWSNNVGAVNVTVSFNNDAESAKELA